MTELILTELPLFPTVALHFVLWLTFGFVGALASWAVRGTLNETSDAPKKMKSLTKLIIGLLLLVYIVGAVVLGFLSQEAKNDLAENIEENSQSLISWADENYAIDISNDEADTLLNGFDQEITTKVNGDIVTIDLSQYEGDYYLFVDGKALEPTEQ